MKFLILAGTLDGRFLAEELVNRGYDVLVSTLTDYGAELAESSGLQVRYGAFRDGELTKLLMEKGFTALIDATHPYAVKIKETAKKACLESSVPYFRWERAPVSGELSEYVYWADTISEAAELAAQFGQNILLTIGSNNLSEWLGLADLKGKTLYVRVLPKSEVLKKCEDLGLKPFQIIAAQGPFSQAFNEAIIKQLKISSVIAKDSGEEGGTPDKIEACRQLGIPLILLKRPYAEDPVSSRTIFIKKLEEELWKQR